MPHEFYAIGTAYLQKRMRSAGLDINLREWSAAITAAVVPVTLTCFMADPLG